MSHHKHKASKSSSKSSSGESRKHRHGKHGNSGKLSKAVQSLIDDSGLKKYGGSVEQEKSRVHLVLGSKLVRITKLSADEPTVQLRTTQKLKELGQNRGNWKSSGRRHRFVGEFRKLPSYLKAAFKAVAAQQKEE